MLLSGALFALFLLGFWLYCLTDAILTPVAECRGLSKPAWIAVISVTFVVGAIAWLIARRPVRNSYPQFTPLPEWDPDTWEDDGSFLSLRWTDSDDAVARHPAGRARLSGAERPKGPDDDLEFLRALDRAIRGNLHRSLAGSRCGRPAGPTISAESNRTDSECIKTGSRGSSICRMAYRPPPVGGKGRDGILAERRAA
jgi:hypothetical protein